MLAANSGVDVIVARGAEGGGHGEPLVGTLPLLEGVLDAVSVPVLAAGGIASGRGLAAVLAAGASGAWMGTAFAAATESLASAAARTALFAAKETDTVTTTVITRHSAIRGLPSIRSGYCGTNSGKDGQRGNRCS